MRPAWKAVEKQGLSALFPAKTTNVPIPGYLFSLDAGPGIYRAQPKSDEQNPNQEDKPHWRVDVCAALPGADRRHVAPGQTGGAEP